MHLSLARVMSRSLRGSRDDPVIAAFERQQQNAVLASDPTGKRKPDSKGPTKSDGRGLVNTPQTLIVQQCTVRMDEYERRAQLVAYDPTQVYAPPCSLAESYKTFLGQPALCEVAVDGRVMNGAMANDQGNNLVHVQMAGLPLRTKVRDD